MKKAITQAILPFLFLVSLSVKAQQWGDYTLYATMNGTTANLVDTNGTIYNTWTFTSANRSGYSAYLMPGGTLVRSVMNSGNSFTGGGMTGRVQKVDWSGTLIWD